MIDARLAFAVLAWYTALSAVTFIMLWRDKRAARHRRWRTPESSLHLLELLGGWPGAMIGQRWLRHKSRKPSYRLILGLIATAHILAWIASILWVVRVGG